MSIGEVGRSQHPVAPTGGIIRGYERVRPAAPHALVLRRSHEGAGLGFVRRRPFRAWWVGGVLAAVSLGCGAGPATIVDGGGGTPLGARDAGGGSGSIAHCSDKDGDGYAAIGACAGGLDCDDSSASVHPGAAEVLNGQDDDCDGKRDNHIVGRDSDDDGTAYPEDCNDEEPLVGPYAIEALGDGVDNNCDGRVDEAAAAACDTGPLGSSAADYAKAIGICPLPPNNVFDGGVSLVKSAEIMSGAGKFAPATARAIRSTFGSQWVPKQGSKMAFITTGRALDQLDNSLFSPQDGEDFRVSTSHPLYSPPRCAAPPTPPDANDMTEIRVQLRVPQNANSLSFQFNFFSSEYPEYVCTPFNDRFIAILISKGLNPAELPNAGAGACIAGSTTPTCNISFDQNGQPVSVNNGFFDVCAAASGTGWANACTKSTSLLHQTGYGSADSACTSQWYRGDDTCLVGGATGWLTTKAPVVPNEVITLRFIILDEGDGFLDSAALIDGFQWDTKTVTKPETDPIG